MASFRTALALHHGQLRTRILWFALIASAAIGVWFLLPSPVSVLAVLPTVAVCTVMLRERAVDGKEQARLRQMVDALGSTPGGTAQFEGGIHELLSSARRLFQAEYAEILVLPDERIEEARRSVSSRAGELLLDPGPLSETDRLALEAVRRRGREPVLLSGEVADPDLARVLEERHLNDAIIGVLHASRGDVGLALVGNLVKEEGESGAADATVFATFCRHASIMLENARLGQSLEELMALKERLHHQAFHDALTGLPNRVLFVELVAAALDRARTLGMEHGPTVLLLDLDGFKVVNDTWGHAAGDDLLVGVADRLRQAIRPSDTPARLGGDEFGILLDDPSSEAGEAAAARISMVFTEPFRIQHHSTVVRPSVGIAVAEQGVSAEQLLRHADVAMYSAKADEVRHVAAYEAETHQATRRRRELWLEIDGALARHEIELRFQPVVSLESGAIEAFEALVRWSHPAYGLMPPGEFLPVADNRQLAELGKRVMWEACRHACLWQGLGEAGRRPGVWINLSAVDLTSESLVEDMTGNVARAQLDPTLVTLEITETMVIVGEKAAVENVRALRDTGMRVAIDDFGTGYSSLSRLGDFPLDMLKIPMPFVDRLNDDSADCRLVDAILRLAGSHGLGVVAEGVEREVQARVLSSLGCELAQGYLYAPPLDGENVLRLLQSGIRLPQAHGFGLHPAPYKGRDESIQPAA